MNPNYIHTITLYNCLKGKDNKEKKDVWYKTVLENCFFKTESIVIQNGTAMSQSGPSSASRSNVYTVRIPENEKYIPYSRWKLLPEEERKNHFTVSEGDIVVYGKCAEEITGKDENTAAQVMLRNKPDAFKVTSFSDNTRHAFGKHYRIGG